LIDDLAVSGLTLAIARESVKPDVQVAGVGMLYNSKTTRRLIGVSDLRSGFVYARSEGGRPPVNAIDSLRAFPERCTALAAKYFQADEAAFCGLVGQAEVAA
jgi:hypothetical protein